MMSMSTNGAIEILVVMALQFRRCHPIDVFDVDARWDRQRLMQRANLDAVTFR